MSNIYNNLEQHFYKYLFKMEKRLCKRETCKITDHGNLKSSWIDHWCWLLYMQTIHNYAWYHIYGDYANKMKEKTKYHTSVLPSGIFQIHTQ